MGQSLQKYKRSRPVQLLARLLTGFLLLLLAFNAGCKGRQTNGVTIQLSSWGSAQEVAVLKDILKEFETSHPDIHVSLLHIPENYYQKLHILIAGDMAPDVIFTNSVSFPIYASQGVFQDLSPYLAKSNTLKEADFYPAAIKAFEWQNKGEKPILGAIPRDISNLVVFYNRDLFAKAGIAGPSAQWTWDEFVETAKQLTLDSNNDGDPDQFGVSFYANPPLFWLPFVWSAEGELFNEDFSRFELAEPAAVKGLQFYSGLRNQWHVAPKKVESGGATMSQLFLQQKLAMMVNGRWSVPVLREQAKFQWDVVPLPVGPSGKSRVGIDASGYAMAASTAYPKESFELIRFLVSRHAMESVTASGLIVPARPDVATSPVFLDSSHAPANSQAFLDVIPEGIPSHTPPRWNEISEELGLALEPVWDGQQDADTAMRAVKPKIERLLEVSP